MGIIGRLRRRWQLTRYLAEAEAEGRILIDIPVELQADVQLMRWQRKIQQASDRWAAKVEAIPPTVWQDAVTHMGRHRLRRPRKK